MSGAVTRGSWSSWSLSILLHLSIIAVMAGVMLWQRHPQPHEQRLALEATVVTTMPAGVATPPAVLPQSAPVAEPAPDPAPKPDPVPEAVDQAAVAARKARHAAEVAHAAEARHVAEQRRLAEARLAAERKAEQAVKDKTERERKEREKVARAQAERDRAEQERKQRELALAEQARAQRESELNAQLAAEERVTAARAGAAGRQYIAQITASIERAWKRPPGATSGTQCEVRVTQAPGGVVTGVQVVRCNRDETVRQSIEDAVYRASPLPQPADAALFDRNLTITFRPEN